MADGKQDRIREEIQAFLKRMTQGAPAAPPPPPPPQQQRRSRREKAASAPAPAQAAEPRRESVTEHVQQHLSTQAFDQRAAQASNVEQAEAKLESRVKQAFDHKLGKLAQQPSAVGEASAAPTTSDDLEITPSLLSQLLSSPAQLRTSILLTEILRRPEERW